MRRRQWYGVSLLAALAACGEPSATAPVPMGVAGGAGSGAGLGGSTTTTAGAASAGVAGSVGGAGAAAGAGGAGSAGFPAETAGAGGMAGAVAGGGAGSGGTSGSAGGGAGGGAACPNAGHAVQFDGDSHTEVNATIGDTLPLGNASRTVEMWVYTVPKSWRAEHHLYQYGGTNPREGAFGIDFGDGPYPAVQTYTNGTGDNNLKVPTDTVKETGWFHFAMVWDAPSKTLKGVINGVTMGSKTISATLTTTLSPLSIGYSPTFSSQGGFTGKIDEFRVWSVARSDSEIQATMHRHLTGQEPGLVAYFTFDEGTGTSSYDLVKNYEAKLGGKTLPQWADSEVELSCP